MLLAEGSKHCCQEAWANATAAEPRLGFSCMAAFATEQPLVSLWGLGLPTVLQSPDAGCCASMSGRQGAVAIVH